VGGVGFLLVVVVCLFGRGGGLWLFWGGVLGVGGGWGGKFGFFCWGGVWRGGVLLVSILGDFSVVVGEGAVVIGVVGVSFGVGWIGGGGVVCGFWGFFGGALGGGELGVGVFGGGVGGVSELFGGGGWFLWGGGGGGLGGF